MQIINEKPSIENFNNLPATLKQNQILNEMQDTGSSKMVQILSKNGRPRENGNSNENDQDNTGGTGDTLYYQTNKAGSKQMSISNSIEKSKMEY